MLVLRQPDNADHQAECLSTELCFAGTPGVAPEWVQLIPVASGALVAKDGRKWTVKDLNAVIAATKAQHPTGICIDINHGTDLAATAGHEAPAAAWIKDYAAQGPAGEPGLWGKANWTPRGKKAVEDGEYRFISPVIISRKDNGQVFRIDRASLVNDPALLTKSLFHNQPENQNVKLSKELCAALGIAEGADDAAGITAATALKTSASRLALITAAGGIATETAITDDLVSGLCIKLKTPAGGNPLQATVDQLQKDLASLQGDRAKDGATTKVEKALADGKITPAQKDWAVDYCTRDPKGFEAFVEKQPKVVSGGEVVTAIVAEGELTAQEKELCASLGMTEETYRAELAAEKKGNK